MSNIIELFNVSKSYSRKNNFYGKTIEKTEALKNITFNVKKGEIFGILGPNGAGKSTLIKIMSTLLKEDSGSVQIFGNKIDKNEDEIRKKINLITGSERGLYWRLTAQENLDYFAELYGLRGNSKKTKIDELINLVGLKGRENEKVEKYSKGMKQRLQIARGLINDPEIIFLDEPTIGLDVIGARNLRSLIKSLSQSGKTIIYTTHYMEEAEEICDEVLFINYGKIIDIGNISELKKKNLKHKKIKIDFKNKYNIKELELNNTNIIFSNDKRIVFSFDETHFNLEKTMKSLDYKNVEEFIYSNFSLEELYVSMLGEKNEKNIIKH